MLAKQNKKAVLSQGKPRDAALLLQTSIRIGIRHYASVKSLVYIRCV